MRLVWQKVSPRQHSPVAHPIRPYKTPQINQAAGPGFQTAFYPTSQPFTSTEGDFYFRHCCSSLPCETCLLLRDSAGP